MAGFPDAMAFARIFDEFHINAHSFQSRVELFRLRHRDALIFDTV